MTEKKFLAKLDTAKCMACMCESGESLVESQSSGIPINYKTNTRKAPFDKAKLILNKPSSFTNDTLYNHLEEIIKRVIDERPPNVIDYFEQFSRDVRDRKFCTSLTTPPPDPKFLDLAKAVLKSMGFGRSNETEAANEEGYEDGYATPTAVPLSSASTLTKMHRTLSMQENVIQLQHYWSLCGLGFQTDDVFQLSWSIQKIQHHHTVRSARFWGRIFGARTSYFVVEADLTKSEKMLRMDHMEAKVVDEMIAFIKKKEKSAEPQETDPELIPGHSWDEFGKMQPQAAPVPHVTAEEPFDTPPEPIGTGLNRKTYFVTQCLSNEWKELPIVTPKQIAVSRKIRKYFTGDLEAELLSYPPFPGAEKHYLRAMIARVTAGTYIAPEGFFRKMTKQERLASERDGESLIHHEGDEHESVESDFEDEFEENLADNDWPIVENEKYDPLPLKTLKLPETWVHCRPHILEQGTVTHIDREVVIRNLTKAALRKMREDEMGVLAEDDGEEGGSLDIDSDGEHDEEQDSIEGENQSPARETGPELFTSAGRDKSPEDVQPWSSRTSEHCNSVNQTIIMRSNLWPGAYTFIHDRCCDSIYLGWGTKFVARSAAMDHLPTVQDIHYPDNALEAADPSVEMEEKWRRFHLRKSMIDVRAGGEEMSCSVEIDNDDDFDDVEV